MSKTTGKLEDSQVHVTVGVPHRPPEPPRWVTFLDVTALAVLFVWLFVVLDGGFIVTVSGMRISVTTPSRVLIWASVVLLVRHALWLRPTIAGRIARGILDAARAPGALAPDPPAAPEAVGRPQSRSKGRPLAMAAGLLLLFVVMTAVMTYPQARFITRPVVPDLGDPLLSTWRLAWFAHQLPRDPLRLFAGNIFHPESNTLAYSDAMLVPSLTVAPLVWSGVHPIIAYNLLFLSGFVLSGATMFVLVRSLTNHAGAALLAGLVFAFLPYRFVHYSHLELQMAQWMPLALWSFHRTVTWGRLRDGVLTGVFLTLQTLSSMYYGIFFATFLAVVGPIVLIGAGRERMRAAIRPLMAAVAVAAVLTLPFAMPYLQARQVVGERPMHEIELYSATPENYRAAPYWNEMFGRRTFRLGGPERELFVGIAAPLVAVAGLWPPLSAARIAYAIGALTVFDASLGFNGFVYPVLHEVVLPYRGLRVPARMAIVVGLVLAIFVGFGAARIARLLPTRRASALVLAVLAAGILMEYRTRIRLREVWAPPPIYEAVRGVPPNVLLELPLVDPDTTIEPIYMYFSTSHWQKLVNGYSGFSPPSHAEMVALMPRFPDDESVAEVRRREVDFVIVHGAFYRDFEEYQRVIAALDRRPDFSLVASSMWRDRETRAYRLLRSGG